LAFTAFVFTAAFVPAAASGAPQAPIVSPCRMCAGTALELTVIVTIGFLAECVWWQIVTLYWYCAALGELLANPDPRIAIGTMSAAATTPAVIRRNRWILRFMQNLSLCVEGLQRSDAAEARNLQPIAAQRTGAALVIR
jgi:hypothetical protein